MAAFSNSQFKMQTSLSEMLRAFMAFMASCVCKPAWLTLPAYMVSHFSLLQAFLAFCDKYAFMADTCAIASPWWLLIASP